MPPHAQPFSEFDVSGRMSAEVFAQRAVQRLAVSVLMLGYLIMTLSMASDGSFAWLDILAIITLGWANASWAACVIQRARRPKPDVARRLTFPRIKPLCRGYYRSLYQVRADDIANRDGNTPRGAFAHRVPRHLAASNPKSAHWS
jgi:hypothetical protein